MSASSLRRSAALMVALACAFVLGTTTPAAAATAASQLYRQSANACGSLQFYYEYTARGDGYYDIEAYAGIFSWADYYVACGTWGQPYAPVLQWKGVSKSTGSFDWQTIRWASAPAYEYMDSLARSGYKDVRFRVCNWNTTTGYVGTCGSS